MFPARVQQVASTVQAKVTDTRVEPPMSGTYSSVVTALASAVMDPMLLDRPAALGGDRAPTGTTPYTHTYKAYELKDLLMHE